MAACNHLFLSSSIAIKNVSCLFSSITTEFKCQLNQQNCAASLLAEPYITPNDSNYAEISLV